MPKKYKSYTYQDYVTTENEIGEETKEWTDVGTLKGYIYQLKGSEQYESNKDTRIIQFRFHGDNPDFDITEEGQIVTDYNESTGEYETSYDIEVKNPLNKLGYDKVELDLKVVR